MYLARILDGGRVRVYRAERYEPAFADKLSASRARAWTVPPMRERASRGWRFWSRLVGGQSGGCGLAPTEDEALRLAWQHARLGE